MIRWFIIVLFLCGFTPIYDLHDTPQKVTEEVKNMEIQVQDKQFEIFSTTPTLAEIEDHQIVIIGSHTWNALMWKDGIDIYKVEGSCVTHN